MSSFLFSSFWVTRASTPPPTHFLRDRELLDFATELLTRPRVRETEGSFQFSLLRISKKSRDFQIWRQSEKHLICGRHWTEILEVVQLFCLYVFHLQATRNELEPVLISAQGRAWPIDGDLSQKKEKKCFWNMFVLHSCRTSIQSQTWMNKILRQLRAQWSSTNQKILNKTTWRKFQ